MVIVVGARNPMNDPPATARQPRHVATPPRTSGTTPQNAGMLWVSRNPIDNPTRDGPTTMQGCKAPSNVRRNVTRRYAP